jgi:hypothetical protein
MGFREGSTVKPNVAERMRRERSPFKTCIQRTDASPVTSTGGRWPSGVAGRRQRPMEAGSIPSAGSWRANQIGKTLAVGYEVTAHLTGWYPGWWKDRRLGFANDWWAAGDTMQRPWPLPRPRAEGFQFSATLSPLRHPSAWL